MMRYWQADRAPMLLILADPRQARVIAQYEDRNIQHRSFLMRMLLTVTFPVESFNAAVRDGTVSEKVSHILEATKPEAVYFTERNGQRSALVVTDVPEPSRIPALAEPWFLGFGAQVELGIAMTPDDLRRADLEALGKKWG